MSAFALVIDAAGVAGLLAGLALAQDNLIYRLAVVLIYLGFHVRFIAWQVRRGREKLLGQTRQVTDHGAKQR